MTRHVPSAAVAEPAPVPSHTSLPSLPVGEAAAALIVHVCAWCPHSQQLAAEGEARGLKVSHGLCDRCAERYFGEDQA